MRNTNSLGDILVKLGFDYGWATANEKIVLWERDDAQPTEAELIAAGWVKPASDVDAGEPSDAG